MQLIWSEGREILENSFKLFVGENSFFFLSYLLISAISAFFVRNNKKYLFLLYYSLLLMFIMCNPIVVYVLYGYALVEVYWRIFWLLPINIVIAYGVTRICCSQKKIMLKRFLTILMICVFCVFGKFIFSKENFKKADNIYKIPDMAYEVCVALEDEEKIKILAPDELVLWLRIYDGKNNLFYGRGELTSKIPTDKSELRMLTLQDVWNVQMIADLADKNGCNIIIQNKNKELDGDMANYQYDCISETSDYIIYKKSIGENYDEVF